MARLLNIIFVLLILALLSACGGATKTKYHMVKHHKPRKSSLGFSVTPPPGKNWFETLKNDSLVYLKISKATAHSYSILTEAREVRLARPYRSSAQFLSFVKSDKNSKLRSEKLRNGKAHYEIDDSISNFCVRYTQRYEDHGLDALRGRRHVNVTETGLFCRHPANPQVAIDVSYLEKAVSGKKMRSYKREGEMFLSSLSFHSSSKKI